MSRERSLCGFFQQSVCPERAVHHPIYRATRFGLIGTSVCCARNAVSAIVRLSLTRSRHSRFGAASTFGLSKFGSGSCTLWLDALTVEKSHPQAMQSYVNRRPQSKCDINSSGRSDQLHVRCTIVRCTVLAMPLGSFKHLPDITIHGYPASADRTQLGIVYPQ